MSGIHLKLEAILRELPLNVRLVAVTKTQPADRIMEAYQAGQRIFGENRVQELLSKQSILPADIQWHLIGHLQTNKVRQIIPVVRLIHSVDSLHLIRVISDEALRQKRVVDCLLQIHIAEEETKFGLDRDELNEILRLYKSDQIPGVKITGLMGMATFTADKNQVRKEFRGLRELFMECCERYKLDPQEFAELSMGMSGDYPVAIEEGGTLVRIGTGIFGER